MLYHKNTCWWRSRAERNPSCIVNQVFDVSFDYIRNVDSTQSPISGINRDNTKRSIKFSKIFRQNFVKIFRQKIRDIVENFLTLNDDTNCDSGFLKIVNLK